MCYNKKTTSGTSYQLDYITSFALTQSPSHWQSPFHLQHDYHTWECDTCMTFTPEQMISPAERNILVTLNCDPFQRIQFSCNTMKLINDSWFIWIWLDYHNRIQFTRLYVRVGILLTNGKHVHVTASFHQEGRFEPIKLV